MSFLSLSIFHSTHKRLTTFKLIIINLKLVKQIIILKHLDAAESIKIRKNKANILNKDKRPHFQLFNRIIGVKSHKISQVRQK